nr:l-aminoadipate-semialdehyde dehydrogenase-phosphopantetheinyl transferase [Quercus suber]
MGKGVQGWVVDISKWDPSPNDFCSALSLLPQRQRSFVTRFVRMEDRKQALVSRLLQYALVHEVLGIPFDEITINRTLDGKPYLILVFERSICQSNRKRTGIWVGQSGVSSH